MQNIEAVMVVLQKEIIAQKEKMAASQSQLEADKLDALTTAQFNLEVFMRLAKAH